jgi:uncharacterized membrane protein YukC
MEQEILERLKRNEEKLEKVYISVEKTRKYLLWTFITTIVVLVLPLIGLMVAIPSFLSQYDSISGSIGM